MNKSWVAVAVIAASALVGFWVFGPGTNALSEEAQNRDHQTYTIQRRDVGSTVIATGVIRPRVGAEVQVGSRVSGILRDLHVTIGDYVPAGFLLGVLDPTEFEARRDEAAAQLESAVTERDFAQRDLSRALRMLQDEIISQAAFDSAERAFDRSAAQVRRAQAALRSAEIQLGFTRVTAPIGGVVASVSTQVGETVAASFASPTFVTIVDLDRLEVWAYVDETDIGRVEVGQRATFTVDTYLDTSFEGFVTAIQPAAEIIDNVVNYVTLIEIGPIGGKILRPEMTTTVNIHLAGESGVLAVPNGAVRRGPSGTYVWVVGPMGPERKTITVGLRGTDFTEVSNGLREGEQVIVGEVPGTG